MESKTYYIDISGKEMAYYDIGKMDLPAILMGHSFFWDKDMWQPQLQILSNHFRLIIPDLWAHGESELLPKTPTSIKAIADNHWQLMQSLAIEEFSVIGLSIGGMWATQMALDHPNNITALVMMGTFVGAEPPESQEAYMALMNQFKAEQGFSEELIESTWRYFYSENLPDNSPLITELKQRLRQIPTRNIDAMYAIGKAVFTRKSNLEKLSQLKMPLAILTGEDDIARIPSESEEMAQITNCKNFFKIKNAGHILNLEQPQEVTNKLLSFLEACHMNKVA